MTAERTTPALTAIAVISLSYLYVQFLSDAADNFLPSASFLGQVVIGTQVLRLAVVVFWPRLRRASTLAVAEVFCLEVFTLPPLGLGAYLTGDQIYSALVIQVFISWIASLMVVYPSVMIFQYARSMLKGARLSTFLPASSLILGLLVSYQGIQPLGVSSDGLRNLLASFFGRVGESPGFLGNPALSIGVTASSIAVIFSVALYGIITGADKLILKNRSLLVLLAGVLIALAWGSGLGLVTSNAIILFTGPTAAIGGTLWWLTREKS